MARSLLSAALIVKNEAVLLPDCLASLDGVRPLLSEIVVYDTGSTDGTQDIARAHGARVRQGSWTGDFSAARNAALAMTRSRWVLIIDADERVHADLTTLRAALRPRRDDLDVMTLPVQCVDANGHVESSFPAARIVDPRRAHYRGAVHEQVVPRVGRRAVRGPQLAPGVVRLEHLGYTQEALPAKLARNEALADGEFQAGLARGLRIDELIQPLVDRARSRAAAGRLEEARDDFETLLAADIENSAYAAWGVEFYADALIRARQHDRAETVVRRLQALPAASESAASWLHVRILQDSERHEEALTGLRRLNAVQSSTNLSINNANLTFARLRSAIAVGQFEEALACCLSLIVDHDRTAGLAPELIALWHDRPVEALVDILSAAQHRTTLKLATQLEQVREPGPTVARRLQAAS